ncbi:N-acetylmuramic acid 6-phosphate etherase [Amaricoccus tamworthensis]|uniref:N-acetylmuramic acid 6-phosphate etherase n=1 Tax=Amaricoccus tamworthensis TaxID=57002 RepID=UPI003C7C07F9
MRSIDSQGTSPQTLDQQEPQAALLTLLNGQMAALKTLADATTPLEQGARAMADTIRAGGNLNYVAAGSSGIMTLADAAELPGTFGIPADRIAVHMAGGTPQGAVMPGDTEDETEQAAAIADALGESDAVISVAASGTTPWTCRITELAHARGITTIAIHNTPGSALGRHADVEICLPTGSEPIEGSTRLGAGTAQKAALNLMSSLMGVMLGHVHDGRMVNLHVDNAKLRDRAVRMVSDISGTDPETARAALETTGHRVKPAVLVALGHTADDAEALLTKNNQTLRPILDARKTDDQTTKQGVSP